MKRIFVEKMKYKKQILPYIFVIIGLLANIVYFAIFYKNNDNFFYTYKIGISVIYNLLFMLAVFLSAENIKNYHFSYAIILLVIGLLQFVRIFIFPLQAFQLHYITSLNYTICLVCLLISSLFIITGAIIGGIKSLLLKLYINGKIKFVDNENDDMEKQNLC